MAEASIRVPPTDQQVSLPFHCFISGEVTQNLSWGLVEVSQTKREQGRKVQHQKQEGCQVQRPRGRREHGESQQLKRVSSSRSIFVLRRWPSYIKKECFLTKYGRVFFTSQDLQLRF